MWSQHHLRCLKSTLEAWSCNWPPSSVRRCLVEMTASQTPHGLQPLRRQKLGTNIHRSIRITCRLDTPYKMYNRRQIGSPAQARGRVIFPSYLFLLRMGHLKEILSTKLLKLKFLWWSSMNILSQSQRKKNQCIPLCPQTLVHLSLLEHQLPKIQGLRNDGPKCETVGSKGATWNKSVFQEPGHFVLNHPFGTIHTAEGRCVAVWFTDLGRLNKDPGVRRGRIPQDSRTFQVKN